MPLSEAPLPPTARALAAGPCRGLLQPLGTAALPRFLARSAAGAAAGCAAVHGLALVAVPHPGAAGTAAVAAACLLCAVHLWRRPGRAAWGLHVVLTTAMLAAHAPVVAHHATTGPAVWAGPVAALLAIVALLLAAVRGGDAVRRSRPRGGSGVLVGGHPLPSSTRVPRLIRTATGHTRPGGGFWDTREDPPRPGVCGRQAVSR